MPKKNEEALGEKVAFTRTAGGATLHTTSILAGSFPGTKARKELNTTLSTVPNISNTHTAQCKYSWALVPLSHGSGSRKQ